ncbi:hypothetical protein [Edaphobacter dinghuensis]|uniref:Lipocalin-like protein n=1 Tax=Edaphobacter dinghuensis TaxID=1560005 RepID=A0A917H6M2_9BACT|nr:hypothetical protein [Edaphobacter dinghuensis]GGG69125.1 hypothetical protein GCM10011585_08940 [Edaphobacter dinghuensis]
MTRIASLAAVLVLCGPLVSAQTPTAAPTPAPTAQAPATAPAPAVKPDLSGTWTLNLSKSDYDQVPPPQDEILVFSHNGSTFSVATTSDNERGKEVYTLPFTIDGNETPTPKGTFADTATLQFLSTKAEWDGTSLILTQKITYQGGAGTLKSTFTLSADGKTLTRMMHISVDQGEFDTTSVYDKQPVVAGA